MHRVHFSPTLHPISVNLIPANTLLPRQDPSTRSAAGSRVNSPSLAVVAALSQAWSWRFDKKRSPVWHLPPRGGRRGKKKKKREMPVGRPPKRAGGDGRESPLTSPSGVAKSKLPRLEKPTEDFSSVVKNKLQTYTRTGQACDRCKVCWVPPSSSCSCSQTLALFPIPLFVLFRFLVPGSPQPPVSKRCLRERGWREVSSHLSSYLKSPPPKPRPSPFGCC